MHAQVIRTKIGDVSEPWQQEVFDDSDVLLSKYPRTQPPEPFRCNEEGGVSKLKTQYTAVEWQYQAMTCRFCYDAATWGEQTMAYSDFDVKKVVTDFQLELIEDQDLFSHVPEREVSASFAHVLKQHLPLALAMNTEKARSELVLINVFLELKQALQITFFSGARFDVDKDQGLTGFCDFLVSQTSEQLYIKAPVVAVVEAKNENIPGGLGQCLAEMVALQLYNAREHTPQSTVYGAVTTADTWKFLKLHEQTASIDVEYYYLNTPQKVLGILAAMITGQA